MSTLTQFSGGGIKSIQRGVMGIAQHSTSVNATITAVDTAKTILNFCGCASGNAGSSSTNFATLAYIRLASSTQVTAQATLNSQQGQISVSYEVIEYF